MADGRHARPDADPELAAVRAVLAAFEETLRAARELLALCDLLQGQERRDTALEIVDRLGHLADVARGKW